MNQRWYQQTNMVEIKYRREWREIIDNSGGVTI